MTTKPPVQPPRLPRQLRPDPLTMLSDEAEYSELAVTGIDLTGQVANAVMFEASHWRQSIFQQTRLTKLRVADVRFENSDFSAAVWEHARLRRVEFVGCRLLGIQLLNADLGDVLFKDCQLEGATFASARVQPAYFENCILLEV
ncbi:MAG: pentapeptide repeat-containing protein [Anaerolineales bacterium]